MPDKPKRYYWDSVVFIKLISNLQTTQAIEDRENCAHIFQAAIEGKVELLTSTASIVEVLRAEESQPNPVPEDVKQKLRDLFDEPYIMPIPLDPARAAEARDLRWNYPWLRTIDAIQVASAAFAKVDVMHTYDGLTKPKGILSLDGLVGNPPLKIAVPKYVGQQPMF